MLTTRSWTYLFIGFVSNHQGSHATDRVGPHYKFAFDCCGFAPHYKFAFKGSDPTTSLHLTATVLHPITSLHTTVAVAIQIKVRIPLLTYFVFLDGICLILLREFLTSRCHMERMYKVTMYV